MAGEISFEYKTGGNTYSLLFSRASGGFVWNGTTFEVFDSASGAYATYPITMTELGTTSRYYGNMPSVCPAGTYDVVGKNQPQAPYLPLDPTVAAGQVEWNGTKAVPLSDLATSGQMARFLPQVVTRGVAISGFPLYLKSSLDHITPFTSGIVSGQVSRDGGNFGALQSGNVTEVGLGFYRVNLTSGDLNGAVIGLLFSAVGISGGGADPLPLGLLTQRTSGL